ncbi:hypothetical protein KKF34_18315 [Myxococcota bacterium]|nr:hypothetical protein [Myxococcota bacterium]MBU1383006.1 hypothetical protein [Myxococcota bacterium]MBU1498839.1 hypothetical protein [Myxococcota bacterium]
MNFQRISVQLLVGTVLYFVSGCDYLMPSHSDLMDYCTDQTGNFHFKALAPPMEGSVEVLPGTEYEVLAYKANVYIGVSDAGDLASTGVFIVNYGTAEPAVVMDLFHAWLNSEGYCENGCEEKPFQKGLNNGISLSWKYEESGYFWYARDYIFGRDQSTWHIAIHSIRSIDKPELDIIIESFTPEPPPENAVRCYADANVPVYNIQEMFGGSN